MSKILLNLYLILCPFIIDFNCFAQIEYKVNFDSLVLKSDAVILEDITEIEVPDNFSAEYTVYKKILIKNNKADKYCRVMISESHFRDIEDIEASITNLKDDLIKELDSDEIKEQEYSADAFYSGDNYKYFEMMHHAYPFIFEYRYTISLKTLLLWPRWYPQQEIPNLKSEYKLNISPDVKFRYYGKGIEIEPVIKTNDSFIQYTWKMENIPTTLDEDYLPPEHQIQQAVYFVSEIFKTDSYSGTTTSWDEYSKWYRKLTTDRYELSAEAKSEIFNLINGVSDPKEKIRILYKHLQKKNRYVAIEMGLAGWQPQYADQVYKNRYGDCKDLSTYMISMLKVAGINSRPALALTRDDGIVNTEQPSNQFNHCIVYVPLEKDTVWLECTSTYDDMEDIPYTIEDIDALVVSDEKGELIHTPQKSYNQNSMISVFNGSIEITGDLKFDANIISTGNQKNYVKNNLAKLNSKDDIIFVTNMLSKNYSNLTVEQLDSDKFSDEYKRDFWISVKGVYQRFLPQFNDRVFINPSIVNRKSGSNLPKEEVAKRKYPVYFYYPYQDIDSVFITIPRAYKMESKPKNKYIEYSFGRYSAEFDVKDNQLLYVRKYELLKNYIPLSGYAEFYDFMKQVIEADKSKFVLKKN
jgi:transglutaminase-like putative cysteine protease